MFRIIPYKTNRIIEYGIYMRNQEQEVEPAIFRIQGYITDMDLPPVNMDQRATNNNVTWMKQHFQITGLGTAAFSRAVLVIRAIQELVTREVNTGNIEDWQPSSYDTYPAIDFASPYFVRGSSAADMSFANSIDPEGTLAAKAVKHKVVRNPNVLEQFYEQGIKDMEGSRKTTYAEISPSRVRKGHLIDITMEFKMVLTYGQIWKVILVPKAMAVLKKTFDNAYVKWRIEDTKMKPTKHYQTIASKRKNMYAEEDDLAGESAGRYQKVSQGGHVREDPGQSMEGVSEH
ncbi:hypothetical protein M422DRAFT_270685 [Sphaerobolus stellatus SS14]|uniref:Uncharacterized protein n=1 Tax=Sphaerobolus stellatus (strain SS14) TaxID=990650 RepID=A0A0C9TFH2_SPHS4|nr:hypothetical protein M422DRAFT_270685 [Sphaerobolus stellatus SS14]